MACSEKTLMLAQEALDTALKLPGRPKDAESMRLLVDAMTTMALGLLEAEKEGYRSPSDLEYQIGRTAITSFSVLRTFQDSGGRIIFQDAESTTPKRTAL